MHDLSRVSHSQAKIFLIQFLANRNINIEFYKRVPGDKLQYRIVDNPKRKSDSIQESLGHQIGVEKDYLSALNTGKLEFRSGDDKNLKSLNREQQLKMLEQLDEELIEKLSDSNIVNKSIVVPWSSDPVPALAMLYGMNNHEVLHTGWNLALMDMLNIERFPALKQIWG